MNNTQVNRQGFDPKEHILYKHVAALLYVKFAAKELLKSVYSTERSQEEKQLAAALADPTIIDGNEALLLKLISDILIFSEPGAPLTTADIRVAKLEGKEGEILIGLVLAICPEKMAVGIMDRAAAEGFEGAFRNALDKIYGRLIKL